MRCHACWPRAGRALSFPGDWLHGVLSGAEAAAEAAEAEAAEAKAETAEATAEVTAAEATAEATAATAAGIGARETIVLNLWQVPNPVISRDLP